MKINILYSFYELIRKIDYYDIYINRITNNHIYFQNKYYTVHRSFRTNSLKFKNFLDLPSSILVVLFIEAIDQKPLRYMSDLYRTV